MWGIWAKMTRLDRRDFWGFGCKLSLPEVMKIAIKARVFSIILTELLLNHCFNIMANHFELTLNKGVDSRKAPHGMTQRLRFHSSFLKRALLSNAFSMCTSMWSREKPTGERRRRIPLHRRYIATWRKMRPISERAQLSHFLICPKFRLFNSFALQTNIGSGVDKDLYPLKHEDFERYLEIQENCNDQSYEV